MYRLLRLFYKSQSKLTPLLLLSKSNPLRWASIWFWVQTWKLPASILLRCSSSSQAIYRLRRAFLFHCKIHRTLTLLLLTPKLKPISRHFGGFFVFVTFSLLKKAGKTHNYLQC